MKLDTAWHYSIWFVKYVLRTQIESGPLEEQQIAYIIAEVIKGLDYLHFRGIRHGDVTSSQVMLSQSGEVKLAGLHFATDLLGLTQNGDRKQDDFKVSMHIQTVKKKYWQWWTVIYMRHKFLDILGII